MSDAEEYDTKLFDEKGDLIGTLCNGKFTSIKKQKQWNQSLLFIDISNIGDIYPDQQYEIQEFFNRISNVMWGNYCILKVYMDKSYKDKRESYYGIFYDFAKRRCYDYKHREILDKLWHDEKLRINILFGDF